MSDGYKRWIMSITYRAENGPVVVDYDMDELSEVHDIVERGPNWNAIMDITIQLSWVCEEGYTLGPALEENPDYDPNYRAGDAQ